jgi:N-acetylglutamate synthase-like GNAT family acetyltransferase
MIVYRAATAADQPVINAIIREGRINPLGLKWQNFLLAVDDESQAVVGTGQIKTHGDSSHELASIAVRPAYRGRGIARAIIVQLIARHTAATSAPLYLLCQFTLGPFYEPFGFRGIEADELPRYFRRIKRLAGLMEWFTRERRLLIMKRASDR